MGKGCDINNKPSTQHRNAGAKGFSPRNLRNMRLFYEEWKCFDTNLADTSAKKEDGSGMTPLLLEDIPVVAFFSIGFSHFDCRRIQ